LVVVHARRLHELSAFELFLKALRGLDANDPLVASRVLFRLLDKNANGVSDPLDLSISSRAGTQIRNHRH
jgi:hypothetical protein